MVESFLIEEVLSSLFDLLKKKVVTKPSDRAKFDFLIRGKNDEKIAIEVKNQNVTLKTIQNIENIISNYNDLNEFYLITPEKPESNQIKLFKNVFKDSKTKVNWLGINQYLQKQNLNLELTDDIRNSLLNLQIAALTSKFEKYNKEHIGSSFYSDPDFKNITKYLNENIKNVSQGKIDKADLRFALRRQFPDKVISNLENDSEKISKSLKFGSKIDDAIIILTDIKNFSTLVSASDPEELNELMSKYYTNAKELVFKYGGVLDKFIGDAVLAIFNYPEKDPSNYKKATQFCAELILLGESLLNDYQKKLDQEIESGTRVGIASGPIYALNIGKEDFEVTFIGDKINFAARLEKNCSINGILMSNRFYHKLDDFDSEFIRSFKLTEIKIDPKDAKGQIGVTTAWQVEKDQMEIIIK
ncbi:adenylate/guanylate cyclase domain-containing protein [Bizionia sp.]|uniref:adenylate/guanylate cyclase domain-containing protein n=1 Tax=Bizionia sp. TaxID=1954480 RepID=UPI003A8FEA08